MEEKGEKEKGIKKYNIIYGLGSRCFTEMALTTLNLKRISSIFGSCNIKNLNNLSICFKDNFNLLFDPENLVYTIDIPDMENLNKQYGIRTLHRLFDIVSEYHTSTMPHHNMKEIKCIEHFNRGVERLLKIKNQKIPILFIYVSHGENISIEDSKQFFNLLNNLGYNCHILFFNFSQDIVKYTDDNITFITLNANRDTIDYGYISREISDNTQNFDFSELLTINEIDKGKEEGKEEEINVKDNR